MTKEEVNKAIAERVMGAHEGPPFEFSRMFSTNGSWLIHDGSRNHYVQNYSEFNPAERIDHAWMVVEKLKATIQIGPQPDDENKYTCFLWIDDTFFAHTEADTAPMAICLAALEAVPPA